MFSDPTRLEREVRIHKRLRELLLLFSQGVSGPFSLPAALEPVAPGIRDILEAAAVEIWLLERRTRTLTLVGSAGGAAVGQSVSGDDAGHYAAE